MPWRAWPTAVALFLALQCSTSIVAGTANDDHAQGANHQQGLAMSPPPPRPNAGDHTALAQFTIFGPVRRTDATGDSITVAALSAWTRLPTRPAIHLYSDDTTGRTCAWVTGLALAGAVHCHTVCGHAVHGRLDLGCVVGHAVRVTTTPVMALVNTDIVVMADFVAAVGAVFRRDSAHHRHHHLMVGRRTDLEADEDLLNMVAGHGKRNADASASSWETSLRTRAAAHGSLHSEYGIDYLVMDRAFWEAVPMPPFLVGLFRWDSYIVGLGVVHPDVTVVDATDAVLAVHLQAGTVGAAPGHATRGNAGYNDGLVTALAGDRYLLGRTSQADYGLDAGLRLVAR